MGGPLVSSGPTGEDLHTIPSGPHIRSRSLLLFAMTGFDLRLRLMPLVEYHMANFDVYMKDLAPDCTHQW